METIRELAAMKKTSQLNISRWKCVVSGLWLNLTLCPSINQFGPGNSSQVTHWFHHFRMA